MYKAKIIIGNYKTGDVVPDTQAKAWESMYLDSPVEFVEDVVVKAPVVKEVKKEVKDDMSDDYLGRNQNVVKKNIASDNLSKERLSKLLESEINNRNRRAVISAIKTKLEVIK